MSTRTPHTEGRPDRTAGPASAGPSLRVATIPRFAVRREEAAASLGISPTLFDCWVNDGKMPRGRKIGGVVLWDTEAIRECWARLRDSEDDGSNPFDDTVA